MIFALTRTRVLERLLNASPDYTLLRTFGCACWPNLHPYNARKLEFCSRQRVFIGYSPLHKGYKCLDRSTGHIYISRDVIFDETIFPFANHNPQPSTGPSVPLPNIALPLVLAQSSPMPHVSNNEPVVENIFFGKHNCF